MCYEWTVLINSCWVFSLWMEAWILKQNSVRHKWIEPHFICRLTDGSQRSGNIALKPVGAWDTKSALCAVSSSFMRARTAPSTASTAMEKTLRSEGHVTEYPALPNGGLGPGQRYVFLRSQVFCCCHYKGAVVVKVFENSILGKWEEGWILFCKAWQKEILFTVSGVIWLEIGVISVSFE